MVSVPERRAGRQVERQGSCRLACWQIQLDRGRAASSGPSSRWTQRPIVVWSASRPCSLSSSSTSRNESEY